jgi:hypothetical protein
LRFDEHGIMNRHGLGGIARVPQMTLHKSEMAQQ